MTEMTTLFDSKRESKYLFDMEIMFEYTSKTNKFLVILFEVEDGLKEIYDIIEVHKRTDFSLRDISTQIWYKIAHFDRIRIHGKWDFGRAHSPPGKLVKALKQALGGIK